MTAAQPSSRLRVQSTSSSNPPKMPLTPTQIALLAGTVPADVKQECEDVLTKYLEIATTHFATTFERPHLTYDLKGGVAGYANGSKNTIQLNGHFLLDESTRDDMLNDTLPHEIAHIVQRQLWPSSQSHGYEWRSVMRAFGLVPTRCHNYGNVKPARKRKRYRVFCSNCDYRMTFSDVVRNRLHAGSRNYHCTRCKTPILPGQESEI